MKNLPEIFENLDVKVDNKDVVNMLTAEYEDALIEQRKVLVKKRKESIEKSAKLKEEFIKKFIEIGEARAQPLMKTFQSVRKALLPLVSKKIKKDLPKTAGTKFKVYPKGLDVQELVRVVSNPDFKNITFGISNLNEFFVSNTTGLSTFDVNLTKSIRALTSPVLQEEKITAQYMDDIIEIDEQIRDMPRKSRLVQAKVTRGILNKTADGKKLLSEAENAQKN